MSNAVEFARHRAAASVKYRSEIDGLRFWAVVPVILFHARVQFFRGGFIGVDIFFVISGYLITTVIAREVEDGRFSILAFYERRARRILPALYLIVILSIGGTWFVFRPSDLADFMASVVAVVFFGSNVLFWRTTNYFTLGAETTPLLHTWSLAVEEQYYLFFPLIFIVGSRLGKRCLTAMLAGIFVASLVLAQWYARSASPFVYYLLPTRAWELMIGAFAALFLFRRGHAANRMLNQVGSAAGLLLLVIAIFVMDETVPYPSLYTLVPTLGSVLVILFAVEGTAAQRFLRWKPFVGCGLISYSAYLWHQPLFAFARYYRFPAPRHALMLALALAVFPLAYLSWRYVEVPFRDRARVSRRRIFAFSAGLGIILGAFGLVGYAMGGLPGRASMKELAPLDFDPDNRAQQEQSWAMLREMTGDPHYGVTGSPADLRPWFKDPRKRKVLVVGNSHGKDLYNTLISSRRFTEVAEAARYGTQIAQLTPAFFDLPNYRAADVIVISTLYESVDLEGLDAFVERLRRDGKRLVMAKMIFAFPFEGGAQLSDSMVRTSRTRGESDGRAISDAINRAYWQDFKSGPDRRKRADMNRKIEAFARRQGDIAVVDRMDYVCAPAQERCFVIGDRLEKYLYDYGHYTVAGARFYGHRIDSLDWLAPIIGPRH